MAELHGAWGDLDRWLAPFLDVLGHKKRRTWAPLYLRGLMGPGERKSLQPLAARRAYPGMTSCTTSSPAPPGTTARCGACWPSARTGCWAGRRRCW